MIKRITIAYSLLALLQVHIAQAAGTVEHDVSRQTVTMSDAKQDLAIRLTYDNACYINSVLIRGKEAISRETGVCSAIRVGGQWATTRRGIASPKVVVDGQTVTVDGINYSGGTAGSTIGVRERWQFSVKGDRIEWKITRDYLNAGVIEDTYFPGWDFATMDLWTGALLDTGGVAWGRYLSPGASYGAHASTVTFFRSGGDACLRVTPAVAPSTVVTSRFSHQPSGLMSFAQSPTTGDRFTATNLRRFNTSLDIWAPFKVEPGTIDVALTLQVLDDADVRGRGTLPGVDGKAVTDLLDTIGRYGVIDRRIMGGNGWLSGFTCLHEPFFGAMGLAINDPAYTANLAAVLDEWRDHGQKPDGRIVSRWHHDTSDNMVPGTYSITTGLYECGWGDLMDSQPDYVINVSELFDLTGDLNWLRARKESCEKSLDLLLKRDSDHDGLVEMMNESRLSKKSSDWIDIVWASWENALVNAAMYEALSQWSQREALMGDAAQATRYRVAADKLRDAFRKPIAEGGFWNEEQGWFAYWRDKDGSIHGDNLVTPVNFCAVGYGIATDAQRKRVLDGIEKRMRDEKLFHWPLSFLPYPKDEGSSQSFPDYENGDIFLSWGELAMRSYASYDPAIALAYVHRVLDRYRLDGLSFQRYARRDQSGQGDDILAGNSMTIVGLYRDLYGVRPQWNRLRLDPHLTPELDGTSLRYLLRGKQYELQLGMKQSSITTGAFAVKSAGSFAVDADDNRLRCFERDQEAPSFHVSFVGIANLSVTIDAWPDDKDGTAMWTIVPQGKTNEERITVARLRPATKYLLRANGAESTVETNTDGSVTFEKRFADRTEVVFELKRVQ